MAKVNHRQTRLARSLYAVTRKLLETRLQGNYRRL